MDILDLIQNPVNHFIGIVEELAAVEMKLLMLLSEVLG